MIPDCTDLQVPPFGGQVQRGPALVVEHVHPGVVVQHGVHQAHVAPVAGDQQRRPAHARLAVHCLLHLGRGHAVQHGRQHVVVAGHRAEVQCRFVVLKEKQFKNNFESPRTASRAVQRFRFGRTS